MTTYSAIRNRITRDIQKLTRIFIPHLIGVGKASRFFYWEILLDGVLTGNVRYSTVGNYYYYDLMKEMSEAERRALEKLCQDDIAESILLGECGDEDKETEQRS